MMCLSLMSKLKLKQKLKHRLMLKLNQRHKPKQRHRLKSMLNKLNYFNNNKHKRESYKKFKLELNNQMQQLWHKFRHKPKPKPKLRLKLSLMLNNNYNYNSNRFNNHNQAGKQIYKLQILQILIKQQQLPQQQNYYYKQINHLKK